MCCSVVTLPDSLRGRAFVCDHCRRRIDTPPPPLSAALSLSDFIIGEEISQGETGPLYRAHQTSLGREVALKILSPHRVADKTLVRHFVAQARRLASMHHPAFVHLYAIGEEGGLYFRSTELVTGESVTARLARVARMKPREVANCGRILAAALQTAWDQAQLLAGGLDPEDVLLAGDQVRLIRAGESASTGDTSVGVEEEDEVSVTGLVAPELVLGQPCDVRASLYALGVLLFRMATGAPPFAGLGSESSSSADYLYRQAPSPRDLVPDFPEEVARVIQRLLLREPSERFKSGTEVVAALTPAANRTEAAGGEQALGSEHWRCPTCQTLNSVKGKYCRECGGYGMEPCPACGQGVHLDTVFCPFCGANMKANRQAVREHGEALLKRLRNCLESVDWKGVRNALKEHAAMDLSVLPDEQVRAFAAERKVALESALGMADEAEDQLDLTTFEATVQLLAEMGEELPATSELVRRLDRYQSELADGIYQANTAYQTRCFDRSRLILEALRPWVGSILGERRAQLLEDSTRRVDERHEAMRRAEELLADPEARTDALQVRAELAGFRLSKKLMVVTPSPDDVACESRMATVMVTIERNITSTVKALLKEDYWDAITDLLERTDEGEIHGGIVSRRTLSECVEFEVGGRYNLARELEEKGEMEPAREAWHRLLDVPGMFLPDHARREALEFEQRRERAVMGARRTQLNGHLSAVFFVWCLAFALSGVNVIADWYDGLLDVARLAHCMGPLMVHLIAVLAVAFLLRSRRVMGGGDLFAGRHASLFFIGLAVLWVVSPLVWIALEVNTMVSERILEVGDQLSWIGPVVMGVIWLAGDLMRCWRYPTLPASFALTLSWLGATVSLGFALSQGSLSDPVFVLIVSSVQLVFFVGVHVVHHVLFRTLERHRRRQRVPAEGPTAARGTVGTA